MQNNSNLETLYLQTLLNDQVLFYILQDCLFHDRLDRTKSFQLQILIEQKEIVDLNDLDNETRKGNQSARINKENEDEHNLEQNIVENILNLTLHTKFIPNKALLIKACEDRLKQTIGIGLCIISNRELKDNCQNNLVWIQATLQMQKQFQQHNPDPIDRFYGLIFVVDLPFDHREACEVISLRLLDCQNKEKINWPYHQPMRMIISYLNQPNRKWAYIRLLDLLWDSSRDVDQKVKILQEQFEINASRSYKNLLETIQMHNKD